MNALLKITDADIERSLKDPDLRHELLAGSLDQLLGALYRLERNYSATDAEAAETIREGALMAVRLADLLREEEARSLNKSATKRSAKSSA